MAACNFPVLSEITYQWRIQGSQDGGGALTNDFGSFSLRST